ncbi:hypothetical protein [Methylorubrum extorquens]|uniref:Uncharacterized protein n=1 Tax=Methylorubrum extorquens DSM 13060 TaxID=882800 RepID=H1KC47_METEX|nr:hypothetical protein [Methylorubrum extorquens]EHP94864.1 hypothetical protein MetexDRAFT_0209 [Methylorubrum extorquens DSM 13060]
MPEFRFGGYLDGVPSDLKPGDARVGAALAAAPVSVGDKVITVGQAVARAVAATSRTASVALPNWTVVVADGAGNCAPADPSNPAHLNLVLGIVANAVSEGGEAQIQTIGDLVGLAPHGLTVGATLFVGTNGTLAPNPPDGAAWRQIIGKSATPYGVIASLGEASLIYAEADALLAPGGFATPCDLDRAADIAAAGYVTPAANARAFTAALAGRVPTGLPPRRGQFLRALEAMQAGNIAALAAAVPTDPGDAINTAWFHTIGVVATGQLAQFAKQVLGLTDAQIADAISSARSITE